MDLHREHGEFPVVAAKNYERRKLVVDFSLRVLCMVFLRVLCGLFFTTENTMDLHRERRDFPLVAAKNYRTRS